MSDRSLPRPLCGTCIYWLEYETPPDSPVRVGECRRWPPTVDSHCVRWPATQAESGWCGEHVPSGRTLQ